MPAQVHRPSSFQIRPAAPGRRRCGAGWRRTRAARCRPPRPAPAGSRRSRAPRADAGRGGDRGRGRDRVDRLHRTGSRAARPRCRRRCADRRGRPGSAPRGRRDRPRAGEQEVGRLRRIPGRSPDRLRPSPSGAASRSPATGRGRPARRTCSACEPKDAGSQRSAPASTTPRRPAAAGRRPGAAPGRSSGRTAAPRTAAERAAPPRRAKPAGRPSTSGRASRIGCPSSSVLGIPSPSSSTGFRPCQVSAGSTTSTFAAPPGPARADQRHHRAVRAVAQRELVQARPAARQPHRQLDRPRVARAQHRLRRRRGAAPRSTGAGGRRRRPWRV